MTSDNLLYAIYAEGQAGWVQRQPGDHCRLPDVRSRKRPQLRNRQQEQLLDGALIANIAAFPNEIRVYQITQNISVPPNQVSLTRNGGDARVNGVELSLVALPSRTLAVTADYALADTRFTAGTDENLGLIFDVQDDGLVDC